MYPDSLSLRLPPFRFNATKLIATLCVSYGKSGRGLRKNQPDRVWLESCVLEVLQNDSSARK